VPAILNGRVGHDVEVRNHPAARSALAEIGAVETAQGILHRSPLQGLPDDTRERELVVERIQKRFVHCG
jgi:hypothetical protein